MINIFFVPGMFGSTIEHMIRCYTKEFVPTNAGVAEDGSMHTYFKQAHFGSELKQIQNFFSIAGGLQSDLQITTPIYPFEQSHLPEILDEIKKYLTPADKNILIYAHSLQDCELNMLFQYHKIAKARDIRTGMRTGIEIFCGDNRVNITQWNKDYRHWTEMQIWELREWLSLFYEAWVNEWIQSQYQVPDDFLKIQNIEILHNTKDTFLKIAKFCNLHNDKPMDDFLEEWSNKQDYILSEFNTIAQILDNTLAQKEFTWAPITIIGEAIVQRRLREKNYEIRCNDLNIFPTNSESLYNLLYNC